jgi:hypothetical protein
MYYDNNKMDSLNNYNVFVINLKRRKERKDFFDTQAKKIGLEYQWFEGYDGRENKLEKTTEKLKKYYKLPFYSMHKEKERILGRIGCVISHVDLLRQAIDQKLTNICIIEDDITMKTIEFERLVTTDRPPLLMYLSGKKELYENCYEPNENKEGWELIKDFKVWETGLYIIDGLENIKKVYDLIVNIKCRPRLLDGMFIKYLQKQEDTYLYKRGDEFKQERNLPSDITFIKD